MTKKILLLIVIVALAAAGYFYFLKTAPKSDALTLYGNVEIRQADLGFKVSGRINKLFFKEGDSVKKGTLLATLDTISYTAQQRKAAADIANMEATLNSAQANFNRRQLLFAQGAIAKEEVDNYQRIMANAQAQLTAAKELEAVSIDALHDTNLYAPSDGIITTRVKEEGSIVGASTIVYTLALNDPLWIRTYVDEAQLGNVVYGTKAQILTDTTNPDTGKKRVYEGHVGFISPTAEFTPKTVQTESLRSDLVYRLRVYIDNKDEFLRQGMPVTIKLTAPSSKDKKK